MSRTPRQPVDATPQQVRDQLADALGAYGAITFWIDDHGREVVNYLPYNTGQAFNLIIAPVRL